ncbi:MAG TPA: PAS domain-containing protein [Rectinemataceae bacterium]
MNSGYKIPADPKAIAARSPKPFDETDKAIMRRHEAIADLIAATFGSGCEVVVNSFEDLSRSVIKIVNGDVTGRTLGSPITEYGLRLMAEADSMGSDFIGPSYSRSRSGRLLKSSSLVIRNDRREAIGLLCINFDIDQPLSRILEEFSPSAESLKASDSAAPDLGSLVGQAVAEEILRLANVSGLSSADKNRRLVGELEKKGLFSIKGAVESVAGELGLTKHTVYKYLRELRGA